MKKKLALILALALAFSLAGCGQVRAGLLAGVTPSESGDAAGADSAGRLPVLWNDESAAMGETAAR